MGFDSLEYLPQLILSLGTFTVSFMNFRNRYASDHFELTGEGDQGEAGGGGGEVQGEGRPPREGQRRQAQAHQEAGTTFSAFVRFTSG